MLASRLRIPAVHRSLEGLKRLHLRYDFLASRNTVPFESLDAARRGWVEWPVPLQPVGDAYGFEVDTGASLEGWRVHPPVYLWPGGGSQGWCNVVLTDHLVLQLAADDRAVRVPVRTGGRYNRA
ncbi:hypothetical protein [Methanopyrus sp.]